MKTKQLEILNSLTENKIINLKDYYTFTVWDFEIKFQGNFNPELVKYFNHLLIEKNIYTCPDNGYVEIEFKYLFTNIKITLT